MLDHLQQLGQQGGAALQAIDHDIGVPLQVVTRLLPGRLQARLERLPVRAIAGLQPGQGLVLLRR
ncbi:hypothetical protein D3C84_1038160 [compost metagenome]